MTTPTKNKVPSNAVSDLLFNSEKIDEIVNGLINTYTDRIGNERRTWYGFESELNAVIDSLDTSNFTFPDVQAGLQATIDGQYFRVPYLNATKSFIFYRKINGEAVEVTRLLGVGAFEDINDNVSAVHGELNEIRDGLGKYTGEGLTPLVLDKNNNIVIGYDETTDEVFGSGLVSESLHSKAIAESFPERSIRMYNGENLVPLFAGENNEVIVGYDTQKDEVFGSGIISESVLRDEYSTGKYNGESVYPIVLDKDNNVILGYDPVQDTIIGLISSQAHYKSYKDESLNYIPVAADINQIVIHGQSLAAGVSGLPLISRSQPYSNKTFIGGVKGGRNGQQDFAGMKPLIEEDLNPAPGTTTSWAGESICSGVANYASLLAYKENGVMPSQHVIFASSAARGGMPISFFVKGGDWYATQMMQHISSPKKFANSRAIHAFMWLQGESNSDGRKEDGTKEEYLAKLKQLRKDIEQDSQKETGQTTPVPFIVYQHSTNLRKNTNTALAFFDAIMEKDSMFFYATPTYMFPHNDPLHPNAIGYKWMGCYFGRAYKQLIHDKIKPRFIKPLSAIYSGNVITITFNVPESPLVLDVSNLAPTKDYGFSIYSQGEKVNVKNIVVSDGNKVIITTDANSLTAVQVKYAIDYLGDGLILQDGASGNLRDSTPDTVHIAGVERPLFYLCPHFIISAINGVI